MKFFKHYKNKPYKFLGIAKHSETLEEMALYECRYENKEGKLWVRPKGMFFENVVINGQETPRFKKIPLDIKETTSVGDAEIKFIATIMESAFGEWDAKWFHSTFDQHQNFHLLLASVENAPVGFKLGYKINDEIFYSWLGGIAPLYRDLGIAADLMQAQHAWCKANGYKKVQTKSQNRFREMLILDLQFGFDVVGFHASDEGGTKVVLEKVL